MELRITRLAAICVTSSLAGLSSAHAAEWAVFGNNSATRGVAAGCTLLDSHPAGLALLDCSDKQAAALSRSSGLTVAPNARLSLIEPAELHDGPASFTQPEDDFLFPLQWGHSAVHASQAWAAGHRGAGARVAVLDSGIDPYHPDLYENIDFANAISFVAGQDVFEVLPFDSHGTHVAGTIAAADNGVGVIGVAPEATLIPIKVCDTYSPGCDLYAIWSGILYAGDVGADIANLSLGLAVPRSGFLDENGRRINGRDLQPIFTITNQVAAYANARGTTIIAAAGNDGVNANSSADLAFFPAQSPNVLAVSAVGPQGWIVDPSTDLDVPAFYTNSGESLVDVAAPGGNVDFGLYELGEACRGPFGLPCWAFDLVLSTVPGGWSWSAGTSMATPHVSGVAALVVGKHGGSMSPGELRAHLKATADDLGPAGRDAYFGVGRVNAYRAVTE